MNVLIAIAWVFALLVSGCASSPTSSNAESDQAPNSEETATKVPDTEGELLILRQSGGTKDQAGRKKPGTPDGKKEDSAASADVCPPGQLMATRVITGETGTRTTEECVTPFSAMARKYRQKQPAAIKVRNVGGDLKGGDRKVMPGS